MAYTALTFVSGETPLAAKWNLLPANDADFDSRITQLVANNTIETTADAAIINLNMATRRLHHIQIAGNRTLVFQNVLTKRPFGVFIQQDGTGSRTITWPAGISWPGNTPPTLSTGANKTDFFVFVPKPSFVPTSNEVCYGLFGGFEL